jgi:hypothetical protein
VIIVSIQSSVGDYEDLPRKAPCKVCAKEETIAKDEHSIQENQRQALKEHCPMGCTVYRGFLS